MKISVVIPAFNEEMRIIRTLISIDKFCKANFTDYELIVVDDCSKDNTSQVIRKKFGSRVKILRNKINKGKGYSVKKGILNAKFPLVLFSDSDLATPIKEIKKMIDEIKFGAEIVVASRNLPDSKRIIKQSKYRQIAGKIFPLLVNLIAGLRIKDTQCGFKLFKTNVAKKIFLKATIERFAFDVEILYIAKKYGFKIVEVPVIWIDKKGSKVNFIRDSQKMLSDLIKIRLNDMTKKYEE